MHGINMKFAGTILALAAVGAFVVDLMFNKAYDKNALTAAGWTPKK